MNTNYSLGKRSNLICQHKPGGAEKFSDSLLADHFIGLGQ